MTTTREVRSVTKLLARDVFIAFTRRISFWRSLPFFRSCFIFTKVKNFFMYSQ